MAAVVPHSEPETEVHGAALPAPMPEQIVPYLISAEHPRTPWLSWAIAALDDRDRASAAQLVAQLLPDQARTVRRELVYDLDLDGMGPLRVELSADGAGRVLSRDGSSPDASSRWRRRRGSSRRSRAAARRCGPADCAWRARGASSCPSRGWRGAGAGVSRSPSSSQRACPSIPGSSSARWRARSPGSGPSATPSR